MGSDICRILPAGGSGSAEKNRDRPSRPRFYAYATCGFVAKNPIVLGDFRFFPALPENAALHRELKRQSQHPRQHPVVAETSKGRCRKPNNDPSLSPPHLESTATVSLKTSYRNFKRPNKATIDNAVVHPNFHLNKTRGCPPFGRNPLAKRWPITGFHFSFRTSYRSIIF